MIAKFHIPTAPLDQYIDNFFYYTDYSPLHVAERFIPDGNVHLIFDLTDYPKKIFDNESLKEIQSCKNVWFSGFRTEPLTIPAGSNSEMLIINFKKGRAFPFLNAPLSVLTNQVIDAELVMDMDILSLREALVTTANTAEKFSILEHAFLKQYATILEVNPFVGYAVQAIVKQPHQSSIKGMAEKVGFSQKHVIRLFKDHVGVTPKEFLKVIRFQKAITEIEVMGTQQWASLALDCGYYDQSHFIADFKNFSGFTPSQYLHKRGDFLNYLPVK